MTISCLSKWWGPPEAATSENAVPVLTPGGILNRFLPHRAQDLDLDPKGRRERHLGWVWVIVEV